MPYQSTHLLRLSDKIGLLFDERDYKPLTPGEISSLLPRLSSLIDAPETIATFNNKNYQRQSLWRGKYSEVMLICWQDGQHSVIHDHKGSNCGFIVLSGQATERFFEKTEITTGIKPINSQKIETGKTSISHDGEGIHQLLNLPGNSPLMTLHLYSTPLEFVNVYSLEKKTVEKKRLSIADSPI